METSVLVWRAVRRDGLLPGRHNPLGVLTGAGGATGSFWLGAARGMLTGDPVADDLMKAEQSALRHAHDQVHTAALERLAPYEFAAEELAGRLSSQEEAALRSSGALPEWFGPAFRHRAKEIRRDLGRQG